MREKEKSCQLLEFLISSVHFYLNGCHGDISYPGPPNEATEIGVVTLSISIFPAGTSGKESACQCWRHKRHGFNPWVMKIPWGRKWQRTPVFLPGKFQGQRSLMGCSPWGRRDSDTTEHEHACCQLQMKY